VTVFKTERKFQVVHNEVVLTVM